VVVSRLNIAELPGYLDIALSIIFGRVWANPRPTGSGRGKNIVIVQIGQRIRLEMSFTPMKLKPESGANRIRSADDAYSFMAHLRLSYRSKPHWQAARQALDNVYASSVSESRAWRTFQAAVSAEGWLLD
jgi:hypothetical protein